MTWRVGVEEHALGHFQDQLVRVHAAPRRNVQDALGEVPVLQLHAGDVDGQRSGTGSSASQGCELGAAAPQHLGADVPDQAAALRGLDEIVRRASARRPSPSGPGPRTARRRAGRVEMTGW